MALILFLLPASEQQNMNLSLLFTCVRNVLTTKQIPVSEILYMLATLAPVCVPPPLLCICEVCKCVCVST